MLNLKVKDCVKVIVDTYKVYFLLVSTPSPSKSSSHRYHARSSGKDEFPLMNGFFPNRAFPEAGDANEIKTPSSWMKQEFDQAKKVIELNIFVLIDGFSFWVPLRDKSLRWYQQVMNTLKYPMFIFGTFVFTVSFLTFQTLF